MAELPPGWQRSSLFGNPVGADKDPEFTITPLRTAPTRSCSVRQLKLSTGSVAGSPMALSIRARSTGSVSSLAGPCTNRSPENGDD